MKNIRVFDAGERFIDRYQVYLRAAGGNWDIFTMSSNALSPQGVNQFAGTDRPIWNDLEGTEIDLQDAPEQVRKAIELRKGA